MQRNELKDLVFTTEQSLKVAIESWSDWDGT